MASWVTKLITAYLVSRNRGKRNVIRSEIKVTAWHITDGNGTRMYKSQRERVKRNSLLVHLPIMRSNVYTTARNFKEASAWRSQILFAYSLLRRIERVRKSDRGRERVKGKTEDKRKAGE